MGLLPIALALAGFVFFVAMINHNTINAHKKIIMMAFFQFCQTAKARHTLLYNLKQLPDNQACHVAHLEDDFKLKHFPAYEAAVKKELASIEDSRLFLKMQKPADMETQKILTSLEVLNHRQFINIKVFKRKVREYNQLIESYPTRLIAEATGKKPLRF